MDIVDWVLRGLGLAIVAIVAWAFLCAFARGIRLSLSFHWTAIRGMRLNGRSVKWRHVPWSVAKQALEFGMMRSGASQEIRGVGYYWTTEGERKAFREVSWEDGMTTEPEGAAQS